MTYLLDMPMVVHIDDDEDLLTLVGFALESMSVRYLGLSDSPAGLETVRFLKPALVLLDIMMPELDGWELLRLIKLDPRLANVKVIVFSVLSDPEYRQRALAGGADDYLSKLVPVDMLCDVVTRVTGVAGSTQPLGQLPAAVAPGEGQSGNRFDPLPAHVAAFVDQYCQNLVDLELISYLHDRTERRADFAEIVTAIQRMPRMLAIRLDRLAAGGLVVRGGAGETDRYALAGDALHRQAWEEFFASCVDPRVRMHAVYRVAKRRQRQAAARG